MKNIDYSSDIFGCRLRVFAAQNENVNTYNSFSAYCKTEMAKVLDTYMGEQYSVVYMKAGKTRTLEEDFRESGPCLRYKDPKATEPGNRIAVLIVKHLTAFYADNFESEQGARAETKVVNSGQRVYKFFMSYENDEWVLKKVIRYTHWHNKKWQTMSPTSVFEILQSRNEIKK